MSNINKNNNNNNDELIVLVVGACCLDRLITVPTYPIEDSKVRSTSYYENGGGNAANTAYTMALLAKAKIFSSVSSDNDNDNDNKKSSTMKIPPKITIKLCTRIGNDTIGIQLIKELDNVGIDLSSPLFQIDDTVVVVDSTKLNTTTGVPITTTTTTTKQRHSTTSIATVIVTTNDNNTNNNTSNRTSTSTPPTTTRLAPTRTCIFTPGTCGELSVDDLDIPIDHTTNLTTTKSKKKNKKQQQGTNINKKHITMDEIFHGNVILLHCDGRHTDVALQLAKEANRRNIPISIDIEKDRFSTSLDELLIEADIIFTNANQQMKEYLHRLNYDQKHKHHHINETVVDSNDDDESDSNIDAINDNQKIAIVATQGDIVSNYSKANIEVIKMINKDGNNDDGDSDYNGGSSSISNKNNNDNNNNDTNSVVSQVLQATATNTDEEQHRRLRLLIDSIQFSDYFTRWYPTTGGARGKQIITMHGRHGAVRVVTESVQVTKHQSSLTETETETKTKITTTTKGNNNSELVTSGDDYELQNQKIVLTLDDTNHSSIQHSFTTTSERNQSRVMNTIVDKSKEEQVSQQQSQRQPQQQHDNKIEHVQTTKLDYSASYRIDTVGILETIPGMSVIVDTTGAGDAFIGAYLLACIGKDYIWKSVGSSTNGNNSSFNQNDTQQDYNHKQQQQQEPSHKITAATTTTTTTSLSSFTNYQCIQFATWVAGQKVRGYGARSVIPKASTVDGILGTTIAQVQEYLQHSVGTFDYNYD